MKFSIKQYAQILDKAFATAENEAAKKKVVKEFADLVINDGKTSKLGDILSHFQILWNKRHNIIDVSIQTADKDLVRFPDTILDKKVSLQVTENKSLIGGSIIKIGDYIIDGSIKSKINALKQN